MTAVEFLLEMFDLKTDFAIIDQAKEMEKQQIMDAYKEGCFDNILDENTDKVRAEQYYNEQFKK